MTEKQDFSANDIVWVWVRNQQPDPGIIVHLLSDEELEQDPTGGSNGNTLSSYRPVIVLANGKTYVINRHRLWRTEQEAMMVGPPFFLPDDMDIWAKEKAIRWQHIRM